MRVIEQDALTEIVIVENLSQFDGPGVLGRLHEAGIVTLLRPRPYHGPGLNDGTVVPSREVDRGGSR